MYTPLGAQAVPGLWPFADAWKQPRHAQLGTASERGAQKARQKQHAQQAIALLWSLQESLHLPRVTTAALVRSVTASLAEHPELPEVAEWLNIIHAQQAALDGDIAAGTRMLETIQTQSIAQGGLNPMALAIEVIGWYRLAGLRCCPHDGTQARTPDEALRYADPQRYQQALAPARAPFQRLASVRHALPLSVRSHIARISVVLHACTPDLPMAEKDWLYLMRDALRSSDAMQRAHSLLALGLAYRFKSNAGRARDCLTHARDTAIQLGWRQGAWLSSFELTGLQPPDMDAGALARTLGAQLDETLRSWLTIPAQTLPPADERGPGSSPDARARVDRAMAFVRSNLPVRFSVERLAHHCHVTPRTLSQDFKDVLGMSPLEFITRERMNEARQILAKEPLSLGELAHRVGYDTALGLTKAYTKVFGEAPRTRFTKHKA